MLHVDYCKQFIPTGGVILDVGAGRGKFVCAMAGLGFKAFGVETNMAYIVESEARAKAEGVSVNVVQGRGEELPFHGNQFDFVNCSEVSEHIEDPAQMCAEINRVLRPGGHCYISFHNRLGCYDYHYHLFGINWLPRSWTEPVLRWLGKQKSDCKGIGRQKLITMHYFTYRSIRALLNVHGFTVTDIRDQKIRTCYPKIAPLLLAIYYSILRPVYFNTFHLLLEKR